MHNTTHVENRLENLRIFFIISAVLKFITMLGIVLYLFFINALFYSFSDFDLLPKFLIHLFMGMTIVGSFVLGILNLLTAKYIKAGKNHTFIFIMAVISCLFGILHFLLGLFTIIEITKEETRNYFKR